MSTSRHLMVKKNFKNRKTIFGNWLPLGKSTKIKSVWQIFEIFKFFLTNLYIYAFSIFGKNFTFFELSSLTQQPFFWKKNSRGENRQNFKNPQNRPQRPRGPLYFIFGTSRMCLSIPPNLTRFGHFPMFTIDIPQKKIDS